MIPIHALLNRIRWDREFGRGEFMIGYYDRVADRVLTVPLQALRFRNEDHTAFEVTDADGNAHHIPFHRVRSVHKNGQLIWQRPP